jgi:membrane protein required for colicin V production
VAVLDWVFIAVLVASLMLGAWRGLVYEVLSVMSWIAAFVLAQWLAPDCGIPPAHGVGG